MTVFTYFFTYLYNICIYLYYRLNDLRYLPRQCCFSTGLRQFLDEYPLLFSSSFPSRTPPAILHLIKHIPPREEKKRLLRAVWPPRRRYAQLSSPAEGLPSAISAAAKPAFSRLPRPEEVKFLRSGSKIPERAAPNTLNVPLLFLFFFFCFSSGRIQAFSLRWWV